MIRLYKAVGEKPGGIIRHPDEIDEAYVRGVLEASHARGLSLAALHDGKLVGEIHGYTPTIYAFRHLISDVSIAVSPDYQSLGIGKQLFTEFLTTVEQLRPDIYRVELFTRADNEPKVAFYERLGFVREGIQRGKDISLDGTLNAAMHMAWFNPGYGAELG